MSDDAATIRKPWFDITLPMFRLIVGFSYGEEGRIHFNRWMKRYGGDDIPSDAKGGWTCGTCCWVQDIKDVASIVHELHHVAHEIAKNTRIQDEEFEAYCHHYLYERVMKRLEKP